MTVIRFPRGPFPTAARLARLPQYDETSTSPPDRLPDVPALLGECDRALATAARIAGLLRSHVHACDRAGERTVAVGTRRARASSSRAAARSALAAIADRAAAIASKPLPPVRPPPL